MFGIHFILIHLMGTGPYLQQLYIRVDDSVQRSLKFYHIPDSAKVNHIVNRRRSSHRQILDALLYGGKVIAY